jgi:transcriptional regulator with XRE-family HTH domain
MATIRELRLQRGWSQNDLAVRVGVHPQAVYHWERGSRTPQVPQMRKLGELFGLCSDVIELVTPATGGPEAGEPASKDGERVRP